MKSIITKFTVLSGGEWDKVFDDGLKGGEMLNIPSVVAITGPNGAGKSRLLRRVVDQFRPSELFRDIDRNHPCQFSLFHGGRYTFPATPREFEATLEANWANLKNEREKRGLRMPADTATAANSGPEESPDGLFSLLRKSIDESAFIENLRENMFISTVRKFLTFREYFDYNLSNFDRASFPDPFELGVVDIGMAPSEFNSIDDPKLSHLELAKLSSIDFKSASASVLQTMLSITYHIMRTRHPDVGVNQTEVLKWRSKFDAINEILSEFLGSDLRPTDIARASLMGRPLHNLGFSEGQKRLLQFCVAVIYKGVVTQPTLLFMDEPECHLHPSVLIRFVDRLDELFPNGQLWLATHSLPLLAHLDPGSIWYMQDGEVFFAGNRGEEVLTGLLGGEENVERLTNFLRRPAEVALSTFTLECLFPPGVASAKHDDPQQSQVVETVLPDETPEEPIRILDWGAGRGRMARALGEAIRERGTSAADWVSFYAFDQDAQNHGELKAAVSQLHPDDAEQRCHHTLSQLTTALDGNAVDRVVLCNVLHEVLPEKWGRLFRDDILPVLAPDAHVLVVEDLELPHGELAHDRGFLLLDEPGIRRLFGDTERKEIRVLCHPAEKYRNRLVAYKIPRTLLSNINKETTGAAVGWCRDQAKRKIEELRRSDQKNHRQGRLLALYLQQFANASLYLDENQ